MIEPKIKLLESLMREAEEVASRSKDSETKVGAVLISPKDFSTLSTGYNGFIRGANDESLPTHRPEKYPYMRHAEDNIITNCARKGISTNEGILICTLSPCTNCLRLCWQAGIKTVYFKTEYRDFQKSKDMGDLNLDIVKISEELFRIDLSIKP